MADKSTHAITVRIAEFIKKRKRLILICAALVLGIILIAASTAPDASSDTDTDAVEEKLEKMCTSLEGVGSCRVMVTYKQVEKRYGQSEVRIVESVAVVCKGADRAGVRRELTEMLSALFGIGTNRIHISKMR